MPANVETMFSVRETPWHGLGRIIMDAPASREALEPVSYTHLNALGTLGGSGGSLAAAQHRLDACHHLFCVKGLDHVIVCAQLQAQHLADVQSKAGAAGVQAAGAVLLVEPLEHIGQRLRACLLYTSTCGACPTPPKMTVLRNFRYLP